jgi:hypothetical protein
MGQMAGAKEIITGANLNNPAVIEELTKDGSNIADWGKYTTDTIEGVLGNYQLHYYYNSVTGATNLNIDYQAVFGAQQQ